MTISGRNAPETCACNPGLSSTSVHPSARICRPGRFFLMRRVSPNTGHAKADCSIHAGNQGRVPVKRDGRRIRNELGNVAVAPEREPPMADDPNERGPADRSRISLLEPHEVQYWADKFGVSWQVPHVPFTVDRPGRVFRPATPVMVIGSELKSASPRATDWRAAALSPVAFAQLAYVWKMVGLKGVPLGSCPSTSLIPR